MSHLPSGNVLALAELGGERLATGWDVRFLHLDPRRRGSVDAGVASLLAMDPRDALWVLRSDVIMCTHGPGVLAPVAGRLPGLHFVDVWHGIGYMPRGPYVHKLRRFDRLLQSSEWTASVVRDLGARDEQVAVTGHAVWDVVLDDPKKAETLRALGLSGDDRPRILVAPTWTHGPLWVQRDTFGTTWDVLAGELDRWAEDRGAVVLFRSHLNAGSGLESPGGSVRNVPFAGYPRTAGVLAIADVLVTDWSSIASDFLPTGRPIVYLDVSPPFAVEHLSAEDRPGDRVGSTAALLRSLDDAASDPERYLEHHAAARQRVEEKVCGSMADGHVVDRYLDVLDELVPPR